MILTHFSDGSFSFNPNFEYREYDPKEYRIKPQGLWLSDESDYGWKQWCEHNDFGIERLTQRTDFECDTSKWLVLDSPSKIIEFTDMFEADPTIDFPHRYQLILNWNEVRNRFGGVLISPYCHYSRLRIPWYYGWDCASAVVWDLASVRPL